MPGVDARQAKTWVRQPWDRTLPLGFADAAVVACTERRRARVLTLDRRDLDVVAGEGRTDLVP